MITRKENTVYDKERELYAIKRNLEVIENSMRSIVIILNDMGKVISKCIAEIDQSIERIKGNKSE